MDRIADKGVQCRPPNDTFEGHIRGVYAEMVKSHGSDSPVEMTRSRSCFDICVQGHIIARQYISAHGDEPMRIVFVGDSLTAGRPGSSYFAILRGRLARHTLVNLGEGNDTTVSLYRRLAKLRFAEPFDIGFLWVGVNDVTRGSPWSFRVASALTCKPPSKDLDEFRACYQATLDLLCCNARRVMAVAPMLKGEDINSARNRELDVLATAIEELALRHERVEYLDLRKAFIQKLSGQRISDYLPTSVIRVAVDALWLRSKEQVDRKAAERGLHLTLDGIHLNSAGAELVAEAFLKAIADSSHKP